MLRSVPFFRWETFAPGVVLNIGAICANRGDVIGTKIGKPVSPSQAWEIQAVLPDDGTVILIGFHLRIQCPVAAQLLDQHPGRRSRHFVRINDGAERIVETDGESRPVFTLLQRDLGLFPFGDVQD
jgi:hypothetical protein